MDNDIFTTSDFSEIDDDTSSEKKAKKMLVELEVGLKNQKHLIATGKEINRVFKDAGPVQADEIDPDSHNNVRYNIFWSMIKLMQPATYNRLPIPNVQSKHKDGSYATLANYPSFLLQKALTYGLKGWGDFHGVMKQARDDYLLPGRGVVWLNHVIEDEEHFVVPEYIFFEDFCCSPARGWEEVRWVARRHFLSKKQILDEFGKEVAGKMKYFSSYSEDGRSDEIDSENLITHEILKKATVWEMWDKETRKIYFVSPGYTEGLLGEDDDPLQLEGFFPMPKPLMANVTNDSIIPTADYKLVQDVVISINELTERIAVMVDAIKAVGIYDPAALELSTLFQSQDLKMYPAVNWDHYKESGGFDGVVDFMPITQYVEALQSLNQQKQIEEQNFYTLTGFSDLLRAASVPYESATGSDRKTPFATLRLMEKQLDIQRFIRDILAIQAQIVANFFPEEQIAEMAGADVDSEEFKVAIDFLRDEGTRKFNIDVETDSTVTINETLEKQDRVEFLNMMGQFFNQFIPLAESAPAFVPLAVESLKFGLAPFSSGGPLKDVLDSSLDQFLQDTEEAAQQPPEPDPAMMKIQSDAQTAQQRIQADMQKVQMQLQAKMQETQMELQADAQKAQAQMAIEQQKFQIEMQKLAADQDGIMQKITAQIQMLREELGFKREKQGQDIEMDKYKADLDAQVNIIREQLDVAASPEASQSDEAKQLLSSSGLLPTG